MNFFPATLTDVGVRLPFGEVTLTQEVHDLLAQHPTPNNVIVGVRPEHLEDAALIDTYARIRALTFQVKVDFVESLGADKYVHFKTEGAGAQAAQLAELAADSGAGENEFVARVSTESKVTPGHTIELAFDTSKITIFDADSGTNLMIPPAGSRSAPAPEAPAPEASAPSAPPAPPQPSSEQTPAPAPDQTPPSE
jgi:multiple sugar transport system ATP-binding protein